MIALHCSDRDELGAVGSGGPGGVSKGLPAEMMSEHSVEGQVEVSENKVDGVGKGMPVGQRGPAEGRGRGRNSEWVWGNKDGAGCVRSGVSDQGLRKWKVPGCPEGWLPGPASWVPTPPRLLQPKKLFLPLAACDIPEHPQHVVSVHKSLGCTFISE